MSEATPLQSKWCGKFSAPSGGRSLERSTALCGCERREPPCPGPPSYTGHFSSFHAISQNIHSYRELMTNDSSIRRFSSLPAVLAH